MRSDVTSMTQNIIVRKILVAGLALFAGAGLVLVVSTASTSQADYNSGSANVGTVPQCAWALSNVSATISLTHDSSDGHTKYVGSEFQLSGQSNASANIYVGSAIESAASSDPDNCSWYGATAAATSGGSVQLTLTTDKMTATSTTLAHSSDTSMTYTLDGTTSGSHHRSMYLTLTPSGCENAKASGDNSTSNWSTANGTNELNSSTSPISIAKLIAAHTTTTSTCTFSSALTTYIPSGIVPSNPNDTYTYVGPTLTSTLTATGVTS